ncbi:MAG: FHA domain-containing protein [Bacteriovoracaceae bacterium]|nr:FHA domain-containing protein [Bacteriovoracaceae bacterium]
MKLKNTKEEYFFEIKEPNKPITIGRSDKSNLIIKDDFCSGKHCSIRFENGYLIVKDLDSKNGSFINENVIYESYLYVGDTLRIGDTKIKIYDQKMHPDDVKTLTSKGARKETTFVTINDNALHLDESKPAQLQRIELDKSGSKSHFTDVKKSRKLDRIHEENQHTTTNFIKAVIKKIFG